MQQRKDRAYHVHVIAYIMFIYCTMAAQQIASAQVGGGVQIVWQKPMDKEVAACVVSTGGRWAMTTDAIGTNSANIRIRDLETGDVVRDLAGPVFLCFVFGEDSTTYMTVTGLKPFQVSSVSTSTGAVVNSSTGPSFYGAISAVYPFADRVRWIVSNELGLFIYNTVTNQTDTLYNDTTNDHPIGNIGGASWIGISKDESQIYSYGKGQQAGDQPVRLCAWDVATLKQIYQKVENKSFYWIPMLNPQSRYILARLLNWSYSDGSVGELYDLRTGALVRHIPGFNSSSIGSVSLSHDGKYIGYLSYESAARHVRFMDTESGVALGEYLSATATPVIQFLPGQTLGAYIPFTGWNSVRLSIDPTTEVVSDEVGNSLQCSVQPNPADGSAVVKVVIAFPSAVSMRLVSTDGKIVQEAGLGMLSAGAHSVAVQIASGNYHCTITAGRESMSFPVIFR